jgi:hypothetical protein
MIELFAALAQDPPPPIIEYHQPNTGVIEAVWNCRGREVRYRIETEWDRARLQFYSGAAGEASPEDLERINDALEPMWLIGGHRFQCNPVSDELLITGPRKGGGEAVSITARWYDGALHLRVR